jgi:hypothetical protein
MRVGLSKSGQIASDQNQPFSCEPKAVISTVCMNAELSGCLWCGDFRT